MGVGDKSWGWGLVTELGMRLVIGFGVRFGERIRVEVGDRIWGLGLVARLGLRFVVGFRVMFGDRSWGYDW